ncbi:MAG TPA: creatininase family protein [Usitatibacter sp.]|nr:creatininase family protein [Usitatibacter sp.]
MRALAVRVVLLLFAAIPAAAQQSTVLLEELAWTDLRDRIDAGATTILVPIGGTEQNGPHLALGKHNRRALALAERIASRLGNALVAPVVAYVPEGTIDPPTEHMKFPGTITVPEEVFERGLESAARSFRRHGFRDIVLLGDHGGYRRSLERVAQRLNREWPAQVRAHHLEAYYRAAGIHEHGGEADTSLTLALAPGMVHADRLAQSRRAGSGATGDASGATAERGHAMAARVVDASVEAIRKVTRR